ncbi:YwiC-like family protein [Calidithermus roseus]|uniref:YwiC-like protein n=1 Tax=Calidithermus roseus TaxID=1644118 RepID=A0A399EWZ4_9DEIN|nr:YwiC-like family protein [Calidithermus roseus]RIH86791.1 YwiC-like protein [Calidithermus roseus]
MTAQPKTVKVPLKTVALPNEHGGWGFTLEPIVLGLLVAPTLAGLGLGIFALAAFFTRHPLKLWLADVRKGKRFPRTPIAGRFALAYGTIGVLGLLLAFLRAEGPFFWPLLAALPLIAIQLWFDAHNKSRNLLPELAGAAAMGSVAAGIGLAGGLEPSLALGLWLVLAARAYAAIHYARTQVMRARGLAVPFRTAYLAEAVAIGVLLLGSAAGWVPWPSVLAVGLLLPFSAYTFARPPVPARVVGWSQMAFGLLVVLLTALGVRA